MNNNKASNNSNNKFPIIKVNIIYVGIIIGVAVISYLLYVYFRNLYRNTVPEYIQNTLIETRDGKDGKVISSSNLPVSLYGSEYNLSFWLKVNNYTYKYGSKKHIISRGGTEIYLHPNENNLHIKVKQLTDNEDNLPTQNCNTTTTSPAKTITTQPEEATTTTVQPEEFNSDIESFQDLTGTIGNVSGNTTDGLKHNTLLDIVTTDNKDFSIRDCKEDFEDSVETDTSVNINSGNEEYDECILYNLPLQRWVHISINFYDNIVEIFIDGKLSSSCSLKVLPSFNTTDIKLFENEGLQGQMNKLIYSNIKLSSHQIYNLYKSGPGSTLL